MVFGRMLLDSLVVHALHSQPVVAWKMMYFPVLEEVPLGVLVVWRQC